jgi:tetratricopeptide (TPR) repeat protein
MPSGARFVKSGRPLPVPACGRAQSGSVMTDLCSSSRRLTACLRSGAVLLPLAMVACGAQSPSTSASFAGLTDSGVVVAPETPINSALGDYLAGNFALDRGELGEAAQFFERALAAAPDDLDLQRQLFLLNLASGRYDEALVQASMLAGHDPEADEAFLMLAAAQARAGSFAAARTPLQALGSEGIAGLTAPFIDAWALFGEGGPKATDTALARLEEGESLGPLNGYHAAMLLDLGGRLGEAATALGDAMPASGPAPLRIVEAYASILARNGERERAVELVRGQLSERRELPLLVDLLASLEAGEAPPPPFADAPGGMADALLGIAEALHQERGAARSIVYARLALFLRPDLAEASLLIADILAEQENLEGAIAAYQAVGDDSPLAETAQLRMARALHSLERRDEAYELLEQVADAAPERTEALVQLGDLARRDEEYDRAEEAYSRALARIHTPERENWTLYYARGITYERTKRWPQAEADFLYALELEPEQPYVLNYLGYSWVDKGMNLDQAKAMLNRAVDLRPNDGYVVDSLGWVYFRLGEFESAVDQLERAVELEPGDSVINEHLGDAYWRVGREREARFQWQRALSLEPEADAVAGIEEKLKTGLPERDPPRGRT